MGDSLATIDMGRKLGAVLCLRQSSPFITPLRPPTHIHSYTYKNTIKQSPGPRPTKVPSCILIHPTVWPQDTNITDRQDRQTGQTTVAQKSISIWKSCRHGACFQLLSRASGEHVCRSQQTLNTIHSMVIVTSRTANECKFRFN